jgi:hypothetical protein
MTQTGKTTVYIRSFIILVLVFLFLPEHFYRTPETGLDPSWNIAVHLMRKQGQVFGRDFVFTYGPLAIFQCRLPIAVNKWLYLLFDIYFVLSLFLVLRKIFSRDFSYSVAVFALLGMVTALYQSEIIWLFYIFLFNLFTFVRQPDRWVYMVQAALLSILCFYFKMNLGLVIIVFFVAGVCFVFFRRKISPLFGGGTLFTYFFLIWLAARLLHVELSGYITGSLEIIDGYNDAMFRVLDSRLMIFLNAALVTILLLAGWFIYRITVFVREKQWAKNADELFIYAITAASVFIIFKSAFVRSDTHMYLYFKSIALTGSIVYLFTPSIPARKIAALCSWLVLAISFWAVNALPGSFQPWRRIATGSIIPIKCREISQYLSEVKSYDGEMATLDTLGQYPGNKYKAIIGNGSADIIPTEISTLYFNGIHYNPRPVMQSYSAYNRYLDSLNQQKYLSAGAPDFLLLSINAIDGRYPFFDETRTKLAILERYTVEGQINGDLLLKKRPVPASFRPVLTDTITGKLGENIPVSKTSNLLFSRIFFRYNIWGAAKRLLYQPPALKITLTLDNGESRTFRAIKPILEDGVILNKFLESEDEFQFLQQTDGRLNTNVVSVRFETEDTDGGFKPGINLVNTYYAFPDKSVEQRKTDSLATARLLARYDSLKPVLLDTSQFLTDSILSASGTPATNTHLIRITNAWAFRANANNANISAFAVLRSQGKLYRLPSKTQARPDVSAAFGRKDVGNSGFTAIVNKALLPPGQYELGVMLVDTVLHQQWLHFSEVRFNILQDPQITRIVPPDIQPVAAETLKIAMEPLKEDEYKAYISGWALIPQVDTTGAVTSLILRSKKDAFRVSANVQARPDVAANFGDPRLGNSGFYAVIPKEKLPPGLYFIYVERQYPGKKERHLAATGQAINVNRSGVSIPSPLKQLPPAGDFSLGVDSIKNEGDTLTVSGWALKKPGEADSSSIDIILKNGNSYWRAGTQTRYRPDITQQFNGKSDYDYTGFLARIPTKTLPAGTWQLAVWLHQKETDGVIKILDQPVVLHPGGR